MENNDRYYIPKNVKRDFTVLDYFSLWGILIGIVLAVLSFWFVGKLPIPYEAIKIVFQLIVAGGLFLMSARGIFGYNIVEYACIVLRYFIKGYLFGEGDRPFKRAFRTAIADGNESEKWAQSIVIEKDFGDGVVKLKDGRFVALVPVSPVNFFTKTPAERQNMVESLTAKFRSMPMKGQIVSYTMASNPHEYIDYVQQFENMPKNKELKLEYEDYYKLCRTGIGYGTVTQKFMVVFSSNALDQYYKTEEEQLNALRQCSTDFKRFMAYMSSNDNSEKTLTPSQYRRQMSKALFEIYNPVTTSLYSRAYDDRRDKVLNTFKQMNDNKPVDEKEIPVSYFLSPLNFDYVASSRYVVVGDTYYSFFYILQDTYPNQGIKPGWLAQQYQPQGLEYHLFYQKIDDANFVSKLNHRQNMMESLTMGQTKESVTRTQLNSVANAAAYLRDCMEHDDAPYYMGILISINANRISRLYMMEDTLVRRMREQNITVVPCRFLEKEAYLSTRLGNNIHPQLWKKMKQNVPSSVVAAMFPFASTSASDKGGIYLGNSNGSPVYLNLWDTSHHDSANMAFLGSNGKGKTFTLMMMALRNRLLGREVFIIAPIKGREFLGLVKCTHGNFIRINASQSEDQVGSTINVMEIYPHLVDEESDMSLLYKKVESLKAFIQFELEEMDSVEKQILDKCIIETYKQFGITADNSTLWEDREHGIKKQMPILGDLAKVIDEYAKHDNAASRLATVMQTFVSGSKSFFNKQTNIDLTSGMTVFDLSGLSKDTKAIAMFATTELIQSYMEEDRRIFKMLFVDEVWMLLDNDGASDVVIEWAKTIRGRGGSLCVATQELADLSRTKKGASLISQSETRLLLGMRNDDLQYTASMLSLSETTKRSILDAKRGNGVLLTRDAAVNISTMGSGHNILTFTTDPNLAAIRDDLNTDRERKYVESLLDEGKSAYDIAAALKKFRQASFETVESPVEEKEEVPVDPSGAPNQKDIERMLEDLAVSSLDETVEKTEEVQEEPVLKAPPRRSEKTESVPPRRGAQANMPPRRSAKETVQQQETVSGPPRRHAEPSMPPRRNETLNRPPRRSENKEE